VEGLLASMGFWGEGVSCMPGCGGGVRARGGIGARPRSGSGGVRVRLSGPGGGWGIGVIRGPCSGGPRGRVFGTSRSRVDVAARSSISGGAGGGSPDDVPRFGDVGARVGVIGVKGACISIMLGFPGRPVSVNTWSFLFHVSLTTYHVLIYDVDIPP
jgi:hypothetical protein